MHLLRLTTVAIASGSLAAGLAGCARQPPAPSATIAGLRIVAPGTIAPGESLRLSALATKPDGSSTDVSPDAVWSSSATTVLAVTVEGAASGRAAGQAVVTASYGGHVASATIRVLPRGTFHLTGRILQDTVGIANAVVTVTVGTGSGLTAQTDGAGRYDLFGVAGTIELHVTTDGRLASLERLAVSSHASLDVVLIPPPPPGMSFDGLYTLEIDAGTCTGGFPEAGKHRVYSAQIQQIDQMLRVSLSDADIWKGSGQFTGTINQSGEIKFTIRPAWWWDYEAFDLIENIGNGLTVIVQGSIVATRIAGGIIGRPNPDTNAADALGIRLNQSFGGACAIQRFQMVPK